MRVTSAEKIPHPHSMDCSGTSFLKPQAMSCPRCFRISTTSSRVLYHAKPKSRRTSRIYRHYLLQVLENGGVPQMTIGAWVKPIANGSVNISRDVVLGNFMGTNNQVQLADTFGFTANVGLRGVDNTPSFLNLSGLLRGLRKFRSRTLNLSIV